MNFWAIFVLIVFVIFAYWLFRKWRNIAKIKKQADEIAMQFLKSQGTIKEANKDVGQTAVGTGTEPAKAP